MVAPQRNVGINSTFEQQRQVINLVANDLYELSSAIAGIGSTVVIFSNVAYATTSGISTYAQVAGIASYAPVSGIATLAQDALSAQRLTGSPNIQVGVVTAALYNGAGDRLTGIITSVVAGTNVTISQVGGRITISSSGEVTGITTASYYADNAGISTYANSSGISSGLTSTASVNTSGIITASSFVGSGSRLTGVVTSITAGDNILINQSTGNVTVSLDPPTSVPVAGIATYTSEWILGSFGIQHYTFIGPGLTGAENDPTLYLVRGQQYKFTNTMGLHPFRIQSTPFGSVGTQYNDGITNNDVSNGTLIWNVQFDTPNILYYQCTSHPGMGGIIYILDQSSSVSSQWTADGIGIHTSSNVGIGTTNLGSKLNVGGDVVVTGVVTATSFYGSGSNITGISTLNIVNYGVGLGGTGGGGSSFDQDLNTTNDVTFNRLGLTGGEISVPSGSDVLINVESMGQGYTYTFGSGGTLNVPGNIEIGSGGYSFFEDSGVDSAIQANPVHNFKIHVGGYNTKVWAFSTDGSLTLPGGTVATSSSITTPIPNNQFQDGDPFAIRIYRGIDEDYVSFNFENDRLVFPDGNGRIITGGGEWTLDTANNLLGFPSNDHISYDDNNGSGFDLYTYEKPIRITTSQINVWEFNSDGSLTTPGDINVSGVVTATSFVGDGSGLTNVVATGSGVQINDNDNAVGTAATINFGANISASPISAGIVTISVGGLTSGTFTASAGISTVIDQFTISTNDFKTAEYTLYFQHANGIQSQKILVMQDGTTAYSNEYAIMYSSMQLVSVGSTISSGACQLLVTPQTGISGITTYKFSRHTIL